MWNVKVIVSFPDITQVKFSQFTLTLLSAHFSGILSNNLHALLHSMWSSFSFPKMKIGKSSVLFGWHLSPELPWDPNQLLFSPLRQEVMKGKFSVQTINFLMLFKFRYIVSNFRYEAKVVCSCWYVGSISFKFFNLLPQGRPVWTFLSQVQMRSAKPFVYFHDPILVDTTLWHTDRTVIECMNTCISLQIIYTLVSEAPSVMWILFTQIV